MADILTWIGTIASLISIPLGFYFYFKGKEEKTDKVKREIVKILLYQINDTNLISAFEMQSVISSKSKENKINVKTFRISDIIDDLISEIISNPLLNKDNKSKYISNLKLLSLKLITKGSNVDNSDIITDEVLQNLDLNKLELDISNAQEKIIETDKKTTNFSSLFSLITSLIISILSIVVMYLEIFKSDNIIIDLFRKNEFQMTFFSGLLSAILGIVVSLAVKSFRNK